MGKQKTTAWLITFNEWLCVRDAPWSRSFTKHKPTERVLAVVADQPLNGALAMLKQYERGYMQKYPVMALTITVTHVAQLPQGVDLDALRDLGVLRLAGMMAGLTEGSDG